MRALAFLSIFGFVLAACDGSTVDHETTARTETCRAMNYAGDSYMVCTFSAANSDIRLFHSDGDGTPYLQFDTLAREMDEQGKTLVFAMNGGMYHEDRRPVGFLRDDHGDQASVNTNEGPGNFHLKPNGVFWLKNGRAGITESEAYVADQINPDYATQSGPMLVIDNTPHPEFNPDGISKKRRNGVGVTEDGQTVFFAISDTAVTFHDFAMLFKDELGAPNALFLDGQVSRIYAPGANRNETGLDMGPIIGVLE